MAIMANAVSDDGRVLSSTSRKYNMAGERLAHEQVVGWDTLVGNMDEDEEITVDYKNGYPVKIDINEARFQLELWVLKMEGSQ
jgi:hypothetical protein